MRITYRDITDAGDLTHVYNEQLADVPHCYPVSPDEFEIGIRYRKDTDEPYGELHSEKIIIGEQDGRIVGFADVAVVQMEEDEQKEHKGLIRFLTYQPGCRSVGQAILEESEKYLRDLGMDHISAFRITFDDDDFSYRFYQLGFGLISDQTMHIHALFRMNGYEINRREQGEVFLNRPEYSLAEPVLPDNRVEIAVKQQPGRGDLPGLIVKAFHSGSEIGICKSVSVGRYCRAGEAQDWAFIKALYIEDEEQGKGWGRYLLQRNLWEMRKIGYKNIVISTDISNHRAQLFYTNYGYRLVNIGYGFVKDI
jgi:GNAT superfamily N-acetyltransferase